MMRKVSTMRNRFAIIMIVVLLIIDAHAQTPKSPGRKEMDIGIDGMNLHEVALSDEDQALVDQLIKKMKKDKATMEMVNRLKTEQAETLEAMINGMPGPEKVSNLQKILEELQALEILFADPVRALKVMTEDGMVPPERLPQYQENPKLLEEDTRKGLYFSFATMAVTLGLL